MKIYDPIVEALEYDHGLTVRCGRFRNAIMVTRPTASTFVLMYLLDESTVIQWWEDRGHLIETSEVPIGYPPEVVANLVNGYLGPSLPGVVL